MTRWRVAALPIAAVMWLSAPALVAVAAAQDEPASPALEAIRAQIPEGEPGEWDEQEGMDTFLALVAATGDDTIVSDFGDGSTLKGPCGGFAYSYDKDGVVIDGAFDAGTDLPPIDIAGNNIGQQAFTSGNRFQVDSEGVVTYFGFMPLEGDGPFNHDWEITTEGISLDRGGDPNSLGKNRNSGLVDLANDLPGPFKTNFTARVEGKMTSDNLVDCVGAGHVEFRGPGLNAVSVTGLALAGAGVIGLLFNSRPAMTWREG